MLLESIGGRTFCFGTGWRSERCILFGWFAQEAKWLQYDKTVVVTTDNESSGFDWLEQLPRTESVRAELCTVLYVQYNRNTNHLVLFYRGIIGCVILFIISLFLISAFRYHFAQHSLAPLWLHRTSSWIRFGFFSEKVLLVYCGRWRQRWFRVESDSLNSQCRK